VNHVRASAANSVIVNHKGLLLTRSYPRVTYEYNGEDNEAAAAAAAAASVTAAAAAASKK